MKNIEYCSTVTHFEYIIGWVPVSANFQNIGIRIVKRFIDAERRAPKDQSP